MEQTNPDEMGMLPEAAAKTMFDYLRNGVANEGWLYSALLAFFNGQECPEIGE